jgi:hypothetical protein
MSNSSVRHEFRASSIEAKSLELYSVRLFKGRVIGEEMIRLCRYQGTDSTGQAVYRDSDGNFKPKDQLTIPND